MRPVQNVELAAQSHENEPRDGGATLEAYVWKPFNRLDIDPRIALTDQKLVAELLTSAWLPRSDSDASVESSLKELFTSITETCDPSKVSALARRIADPANALALLTSVVDHIRGLIEAENGTSRGSSSCFETPVRVRCSDDGRGSKRKRDEEWSDASKDAASVSRRPVTGNADEVAALCGLALRLSNVCPLNGAVEVCCRAFERPASKTKQPSACSCRASRAFTLVTLVIQHAFGETPAAATACVESLLRVYGAGTPSGAHTGKQAESVFLPGLPLWVAREVEKETGARLLTLGFTLLPSHSDTVSRCARRHAPATRAASSCVACLLEHRDTVSQLARSDEVVLSLLQARGFCSSLPTSQAVARRVLEHDLRPGEVQCAVCDVLRSVSLFRPAFHVRDLIPCLLRQFAASVVEDSGQQALPAIFSLLEERLSRGKSNDPGAGTSDADLLQMHCFGCQVSSGELCSSLARWALEPSRASFASVCTAARALCSHKYVTPISTITRDFFESVATCVKESAFQIDLVASFVNETAMLGLLDLPVLFDLGRASTSPRWSEILSRIPVSEVVCVAASPVRSLLLCDPTLFSAPELFLSLPLSPAPPPSPRELDEVINYCGSPSASTDVLLLSPGYQVMTTLFGNVYAAPPSREPCAKLGVAAACVETWFSLLRAENDESFAPSP